MIPLFLKDTLNYLFSLDMEASLRVFWFFLVFDFPRYILTDFYLLFLKLFKKTPRADRDFLRNLHEAPPLVSVIIPALNEETTIGWTIRSLEEQTYKHLQIIIVDDGSTDRTPKICRHLARKHQTVEYYRFSERGGKSAVLNYGLKFSRGKFVVFVDSDTTFDRDAIYHIIKAFADPEVGGVSGNLRVRNYKRSLLTSLQQIEYIFTISIGRQVRATFGILPIISGAFGCFRKEIISTKTNGGHEPGPGNDSDLAIRVRKLGYRIIFEPKAVCLTNVPHNLQSLIKQRARWDRNLIKNRVRKHSDVYNPFTQNFRLLDVITFVDSIFFHLFLSAVTAFYLFDLSIHFSSALPILLTINFILYFCAEVFELLIAVILSGRKEDLKLLLYVPLFNPYKLFIKFVRLMAYAQELLFKFSYNDPFAPYKVRQKMIRW